MLNALKGRMHRSGVVTENVAAATAARGGKRGGRGRGGKALPTGRRVANRDSDDNYSSGNSNGSFNEAAK